MELNSAIDNVKSKSASPISVVWDLVGLAVPAIAVAPALLFLVGDSTSTPNFIIGLLALAGLIALAWFRSMPCNRVHTQKRHQLHLASVGLGAALLCWSTWVFYPPGAVVAGLLFLFAWICSRSANPWPEVAGWCCALGSFIGFPFAFFSGMTNWITYLVGGTVVGVLDFFQIPNLAVGTLFESAGLQFSILNTSGGVGSLTLLVTITFLFLVHRRESLLCGLLAVFAVPVWLYLSLVVRMLVIVIVMQWVGRDLSNGMDFLLLSAGTFVFACLLSWLCIVVLRRMTAPMVATEDDFGPALEHFNHFLRWPQEIPARSDARTGKSLSADSDGVEFTKSGLQIPHIVLASVVGLCGLMSITVVARGSAVPRWQQDLAWVASVREKLEAAELPADRAGFRRVALTPEQVSEPLLAAFQAGQQTVEVSAIAPQFGWEDPARSYEVAGWTVRGEFKSDSKWPFYAAAFELDSGVYRYVFASCADKNLYPLDFVPNYAGGGETAAPSPNVLGLLGGELRSSDVPNVRLQMTCETAAPLGRVKTAELIAELEAVFLEIRDSLVQSAD